MRPKNPYFTLNLCKVLFYNKTLDKSIYIIYIIYMESNNKELKMNTFTVAIHDEFSDFTFKIECGNHFEGLLFYIATFTQGFKKDSWFTNADYSFTFFNKEDFEKICNYAKKYAEII